jgi:MftR C-terminal domain
MATLVRSALHAQPGLVMHQVAAYGATEDDLAAQLSQRLFGPDVELRSRLLAAAFLSTLRVAVQNWLEHQRGSLRDAIRLALAYAAPEPSTTAPLRRVGRPAS